MVCPKCGTKISRVKQKLIVSIIIAIIAVLAVAGFAGYRFVESSVKIDMDTIGASIKSIAELATVEYVYTDVGVFSNNLQFMDYDVPLTEKSFIVKWDGKIKAGINAEEIIIKDDPLTRVLNVSLPEAQILSNEIYNDKFETLDQKNSIFNPLQVDDYNSFSVEGKQKTEQKAIENGLLSQATDNAKTFIINSLNSIPFISENYTITFVN